MGLTDIQKRLIQAISQNDMGEMAKLCSKEGLKIGRNRLFEILIKNKILMSNNNPYQKYIDKRAAHTRDFSHELAAHS